MLGVPQRILNDAEYILHKLFSYLPDTFRELENINILVIGSGFFPSFIPLVKTITGTCLKVKIINFTLLEPNQQATEHFKKTFSPIDLERFNIKIDFSLHNIDAKTFLMIAKDHAYDLIYFEHPDYSIYNVILAKLGLSNDKLAISLQESISYLSKIIKDQVIILGVFIFSAELNEIKCLINFTLRMKKINIVRPRKTYFNGHYYSNGLIGVVEKKQLPDKTPNRLLKGIR